MARPCTGWVDCARAGGQKEVPSATNEAASKAAQTRARVGPARASAWSRRWASRCCVTLRSPACGPGSAAILRDALPAGNVRAASLSGRRDRPQPVTGLPQSASYCLATRKQHNKCLRHDIRPTPARDRFSRERSTATWQIRIVQSGDGARLARAGAIAVTLSARVVASCSASQARRKRRRSREEGAGSHRHAARAPG